MSDNPISETKNKFLPVEKEDNLTKISKSICQLKIENKLTNEIETNVGAGFLLKFWIDLDIFNCLISNEQMITRNIVDNISNNIIIKYDNELKKINIKLDKNKRYIKNFNDIGLDITVVEVLDEDNIHDDYFLWAEPEDFVKNNDLIKSNIYIPQYAQGKELVNSRGLITDINKYEFTHLASTEHGSSGSPKFLEKNILVIGIHKEGNKNKNENYGDFIYPIFNIIKKDINKKRNKGKFSWKIYLG